MKKVNILWILSIVFFIGCETDTSNETLDTNVQGTSQIFNASKTIKNNGKYLDFAYYNEFEATRKFYYLKDQGKKMELDHSNYVPVSPKELSDQLGFKSLGHIFDELMEIQETYLEEVKKTYGSLSKDELEKIDPNSIPRFASEIYDRTDILNLDEENGIFNLKIHDSELAYLLNEDGIIAVAGAVYQYTEDTVKYMPMNGLNSINDLLVSESNNDDVGIKVSEIKVSYSTTAYQRGGVGSTFCRDEVRDPTTGPQDLSSPLVYYYHTAGFVFTNYTAFVNTYNCAYDGAYYACWYGTTSGLTYEQKLQTCCSVQSTSVQKSRVTSDLTGYKREKFLFWWMHTRHDMVTIRISGNMNYTRNGIFVSESVNRNSSNNDQISTTIYDDLYIESINVSLDYTSNARTDLDDLECTINW